MKKNKKIKNIFENTDASASRGFTLLELLVVVAIIGILSSVVMYSVNTVRVPSRDAKRFSDIKQISTAIEFYYDKYGVYPNGGPINPLRADSRNPPNLGVPAYANLAPALVPEFIPELPLPPRNNSGDGLMCSNCDEYRYEGRAGGGGYMICTYLATTKYKNGENAFGPYYCATQGCAAGSPFGACLP